LFIDACGVTERGSLGKSILFVARAADVLEATHNISMEQVETCPSAARRKLLQVLEARVKPARDEKVLTGRNGLMLAAFAEAARVLKRDDYGIITGRNTDFLLRARRDWGRPTPLVGLRRKILRPDLLIVATPNRKSI
jgi:uncharacterized protein